MERTWRALVPGPEHVLAPAQHPALEGCGQLGAALPGAGGGLAEAAQRHAAQAAPGHAQQGEQLDLPVEQRGAGDDVAPGNAGCQHEGVARAPGLGLFASLGYCAALMAMTSKTSSG